MNEFSTYISVLKLFKQLDVRGISHSLASDGSKILLWPRTHRARVFDNVGAVKQFLEGYDYALEHMKES